MTQDPLMKALGEMAEGTYENNAAALGQTLYATVPISGLDTLPVHISHDNPAHVVLFVKAEDAAGYIVRRLDATTYKVLPVRVGSI